MTKTCPSCRRSLSAAAFNDSARSADGLANRCRACTNARRRELEAARKAPRKPSVNLAAALRHGDVKAVRARLRAGAKPHWAWICETMREGHLSLAEMLLASGVEPNLFTMAALADVAGIKRRLRRSPGQAVLTVDMTPNFAKVTPLHVACASDWRGHGPARMAAQVDAAKLLKDHGADLNAKARCGLDDATPLLCACWTSGNAALVRWLLGAGAVASDRDFMAALGHFQRHRRAANELPEILLARGVPVDGSVAGDRTPLQAAAHQGVHQTVAWLIAHGAKVNARGPGGRTAAHLAAERNTGPKTLTLLARNGADLTARDDDGHTPLDLAKLNGKKRVVEWLMANGANKTKARRRRTPRPV
jgi:hypothetical protein